MLTGKFSFSWVAHGISYESSTWQAMKYQALFSENNINFRLNDGLFVKLSPVGWGLTICLWPRRGSTIGFHLVYSRISHEYSSLFFIVINLIFMFSL